MKTEILLLLAFAATAGAAVTLQINGTDYNTIALKTGQNVTVQVVSDDASIYSAFIGFEDAASILGTFTHLSTETEAGNLASVATNSPPPVEGFYVSAAGAAPAPSAGVHFTFSYNPTTVGVTTLYLYASDATTVLDTIDVTVEPAQVGSSFTYQGRLIDDNEATDAAYDFEFRLYDAPTEGTQVGTVNAADDLDVISGYFTVELDFGAAAYNGDSVWLEVAVRDGDETGAYTVLTPRQRLTATPYASYAAASDWNNLANVPADIADGDDDTHLTESQVETYITNDLTFIHVPFANGNTLGDTSLRYQSDFDVMSLGNPSIFSNRKFDVYTDDCSYGIRSENINTSGTNYAICGTATGNITGSSYGVYGSTYSNGGGNNFGLYGLAPTATSGNNYGVYGYAANSGSGNAWAGYFYGDAYVSGSLGVGTNSPEGKIQIVGDEVRIGNAGTVDYATADGDLYVEDELEVDGNIHAANMPGCEYTSVLSYTDLPTSWTNVGNLSLTLDRGGYIIVTFSGSVSIDTAGDLVYVAIGTSESGYNYGAIQYCESQSAGDYIPFNVQFVFSASSADTYTYYGNARSISATGDILFAKMTAMYFPVRY